MTLRRFTHCRAFDHLSFDPKSLFDPMSVNQILISYSFVQEITAATIENIILERFGSKSMRIFRYIREKKYLEENQIQQVRLKQGFTFA